MRKLNDGKNTSYTVRLKTQTVMINIQPHLKSLLTLLNNGDHFNLDSMYSMEMYGSRQWENISNAVLFARQY